MRQLVVIRTYPEAYRERPGEEEVAGPISEDTEHHLIDFVARTCGADPGSCGYRIEEVDTEQM